MLVHNANLSRDTLFYIPGALPGRKAEKNRVIFFFSFSFFRYLFFYLLRSTLGERFVIFGDPVVDGIPVHARREDSRFLVTWTGDVQNLRHFE